MIILYYWLQETLSWSGNHVPPPSKYDIFPIQQHADINYSHNFCLYFCPFSINFTILLQLFKPLFLNSSFLFMIFPFSCSPFHVFSKWLQLTSPGGRRGARIGTYTTLTHCDGHINIPPKINYGGSTTHMYEIPTTLPMLLCIEPKLKVKIPSVYSQLDIEIEIIFSSLSTQLIVLTHIVWLNIVG